ncbi:hypothetical protein ACFC1B_20980, partial [Streptomyces xiamenensis]|uniref:primosomal protein N' family DNA-binding protein n=1 Tax=Streptomyces xiamenensis TaxID=408015 RepID=UPI0035E9723F
MSGEQEHRAAGAEQLALIRASVRAGRKEPPARPRTWRGAALAEGLPVARVLVDKGLVHLDRYFDYAVPAAMDAEAQPGVRVRVRFGAGERGGRREGGGLINGFIVERRAESDFPGTLAPIAQVLSTEPVLTPALLALCRAVADRYAGALADVVQLAVPPRRARPEKQPSPPAPPPPAAPEPGGWARYPRGAGFLAALARGEAWTPSARGASYADYVEALREADDAQRFDAGFWRELAAQPMQALPQDRPVALADARQSNVGRIVQTLDA